MRVQPVPVLLAIALSLTGAGAFATDYSMLYKPSFARLSLLSSQRVFQSECAGLAIHLAQTRPASYKAAASRLVKQCRGGSAPTLAIWRTVACM